MMIALFLLSLSLASAARYRVVRYDSSGQGSCSVALNTTFANTGVCYSLDFIGIQKSFKLTEKPLTNGTQVVVFEVWDKPNNCDGARDDDCDMEIEKCESCENEKWIISDGSIRSAVTNIMFLVAIVVIAMF